MVKLYLNSLDRQLFIKIYYFKVGKSGEKG